MVFVMHKMSLITMQLRFVLQAKKGGVVLAKNYTHTPSTAARSIISRAAADKTFFFHHVLQRLKTFSPRSPRANTHNALSTGCSQIPLSLSFRCHARTLLSIRAKHFLPHSQPSNLSKKEVSRTATNPTSVTRIKL